MTDASVRFKSKFRIPQNRLSDTAESVAIASRLDWRSKDTM